LTSHGSFASPGIKSRAQEAEAPEVEASGKTIDFFLTIRWVTCYGFSELRGKANWRFSLGVRQGFWRQREAKRRSSD
jgi:hypothetical protein